MDLKQQAAAAALAYVQDGMILGLGTGSTAGHFVDLLGERLRSGGLRGIVGVPTSEGTAARARAAGIPLGTLDEFPRLDLAVDGADEVDPALDLVKGLGQALLREKIIEIHAGRFVVVVDEHKLVPRLGTSCPLPVEVVPFAARASERWLNTLGCRAELWREDGGRGSLIVTDNGNYLARCWFPDGISDPHGLAATLAGRPGIVEHGLFLGMAAAVVVAGSGGIRVLERQGGGP